MESVFQICEPSTILDLPIEDLAYSLLTLARANEQNGHFHPASFIDAPGVVLGVNAPAVDYLTRNKVERAVQEAICWLESQCIIAREAGPNGDNGHRFITRRGEQLLNRDHFKSYQAAASFPKSLLHPKIAEEVWSDLARGDLQTAVFRAFKAVEEAVREAGGFSLSDYGVDLMRRAFAAHKGPLSDTTQPVAEQEAVSALFAGAIGSYKNPHSHRTVAINELQEAQEMVMLASHLLRIVDARRLANR